MEGVGAEGANRPVYCKFIAKLAKAGSWRLASLELGANATLLLKLRCVPVKGSLLASLEATARMNLWKPVRRTVLALAILAVPNDGGDPLTAALMATA